MSNNSDYIQLEIAKVEKEKQQYIKWIIHLDEVLENLKSIQEEQKLKIILKNKDERNKKTK